MKKKMLITILLIVTIFVMTGCSTNNIDNEEMEADIIDIVNYIRQTNPEKAFTLYISPNNVSYRYIDGELIEVEFE